MKKIHGLALSLFVAGALAAQAPPPSQRLVNLARALPPVGKNVELKTLGVQLVSTCNSAPKSAQDEATYTIYYPGNLDRRSTDDAAYVGRFPGLHLNLPLKAKPSHDISFLFLSDQPERILDDRKRTPAVAPDSPIPGPGATGIYARSPIPAGSKVRVLVDHTNGTKRPLRFDLIWIPRKDGFLTVSKRSLRVDQDSVAAGNRALSEMAEMVVEPRKDLKGDTGIMLLSQLLKPEDTLVLHLEYFSSAAGDLAAVVSEVDAAPTDQQAKLDALPVLHSIVWKEEEERLGKFIDKNADPTRWNRIRQSYQHARGHFAAPDRMAEVDYNVSSWNESDHPVQIYSKFESIPGVDVTVQQGGASAVTDNRGKYGAKVFMRWNIKSLPPDCSEVAVVALNRGAVFGGRHSVTDGKRTAFEVFHTPGGPGLLKKLSVSTLWRGPLRAGDQLEMSTEPMANTSVQLWYMLVPLPPQ